ncbi:MAG: V-type ATP synthase subunit B [Candidatus Dormiibacterota bacterium]
MIDSIPVEYVGGSSVSGPLLVVEGVTGVGWDEYVSITLDSGEQRHGVVLDVDDNLAVVQVFEGTSGISLGGIRVAFSGTPMRVPVGQQWLGRVCNGRGDPIDGGPPVRGERLAPVNGLPINPAARTLPSDPVITGISAIDGLTTLVRGQKLPIFSVGGLPHLELAAQIAAQAHVAGGAFQIVFAAMGVTHADADSMRDALEERSESGELVLLINTASDPVIERVLTPRIALTVAEHLAFERGGHVLVVMCDMTSYAEAVREVSAARGEVPGRHGYPGYLFSDLASLYERCGRLRVSPGSLTQIPVLTMPAGDITHPVPDLTGYITEGQVVLSQEMQSRGIYPPFDAMSSLSRLMRHGVGAGRTRSDHMAVAGQVYAALSRAGQVRELTDLVGETGIGAADRAYLRFADQLEQQFINQRRTDAREVDDSLERAWAALTLLPAADLSRLDPVDLSRHGIGAAAASTGVAT